MVPVSDPKTWVPYMNTRDCSQGFCSLYCPQWCYIIFPPPPPFDFPEDNSGPSFSPLVIAIIGILASAFLLVSYYAIMSKYCGSRSESRRRRRENDQAESDESDENQDPSIHEQPWNAANTGLDEALIKSITVFKYKKGDGVIDGSDCSVCLSEFQEDESLRLLPKCSHAFHVSCIDTWLKSHSNCPLCRSNIVFLNAALPPPIMEAPSRNDQTSVAELQNEEEPAAEDGSAENNNTNLPKSPARELQHAITIREDETQADTIRRSVSMDFSCQGRLSIADILRIDHDEECSFHDCQMQERETGIGSSKQPAEIEVSSRHNSSHRHSVLSCVISPAVMHRSFSSGRFLFPKLNRAPNTSILPS